LLLQNIHASCAWHSKLAGTPHPYTSLAGVQQLRVAAPPRLSDIACRHRVSTYVYMPLLHLGRTLLSLLLLGLLGGSGGLVLGGLLHDTTLLIEPAKDIPPRQNTANKTTSATRLLRDVHVQELHHELTTKLHLLQQQDHSQSPHHSRAGSRAGKPLGGKHNRRYLTLAEAA
jgi:hypothetical protein